MPGSLSGQSSSGTNTAGFLGSGSPFRRRGGRVFILEAIRLGLQWPWTAGSSSGVCLVQEVQKGFCEAAVSLVVSGRDYYFQFLVWVISHLQHIYMYTSMYISSIYECICIYIYIYTYYTYMYIYIYVVVSPKG